MFNTFKMAADSSYEKAEARAIKYFKEFPETEQVAFMSVSRSGRMGQALLFYREQMEEEGIL